jgi:glycine cleavage system H protein
MSTPAIPDDRSYTEDHEWVLITPGSPLPDTPIRVGITSVAVEALGDLVFVELPEVGSAIVAGETCGEIESTKTVSELYPPVSGVVTSINSAVVEDPDLITHDPYGAGWLFEVQATATGDLLAAAEYGHRQGAQS